MHGVADTLDKPGVGRKPAKAAQVLFDGTGTERWQHSPQKPFAWKLEGDSMEVVPRTGSLTTKQPHGDCELHIEFCIPDMPDKKGQSKGNSGVKLQGQVEIQILDSVDNPTYKAGGCGSIYTLRDPDRNMARPAGEWQSYDILYRAPRFDAEGKLTDKPRITLWWNGEKVHDNVEVARPTSGGEKAGPFAKTGPLLLQDHSCPVKFRNIWMREIHDETL
jgi:hypothetical protein